VILATINQNVKEEYEEKGGVNEEEDSMVGG